MATVAAPVFRFDKHQHAYTLDGALIPHITGMLEQTGYVDDTYFTEDCADRGHHVHLLTAQYDLGAIEDPTTITHRVKGWVLAYVKAMQDITHEWVGIEEAHAHPKLRFGGRPDRDGYIWRSHAILEIKSGPPAPWHGVQTALHDILLCGSPERAAMPVGVRFRFGLYLQKNGKYRFIPHDGTEPRASKGKRDYDTAYEIIRECCR